MFILILRYLTIILWHKNAYNIFLVSSVMLKHVKDGKHIEYMRQKFKKKHAHFKVSSREEVFKRLFSYILGWNFIPVSADTWDEILFVNTLLDNWFSEINLIRNLYIRASKLIKPLSINPTKWSTHSNNSSANCRRNFLTVFEHFLKLPIKGLIPYNLEFAIK